MPLFIGFLDPKALLDVGGLLKNTELGSVVLIHERSNNGTVLHVMYVKVVSRFDWFNTILLPDDTIDSFQEFIHTTLYIPPQYQKLYLNGTHITSLNPNDWEEWNVMEVVDIRDE